jgi:outer membrane protein OmpA-like peptidoglycan-associated protein
MNNTKAIQQGVPVASDIINVLKETADGEWVCASRLWRMAMGGIRLADPDLVTMTRLMNEIRHMVERGDLEAAQMGVISIQNPELVKLNGQIVNPADPEQMRRYVHLHPLARDLTLCYKLTPQGRGKGTSFSGYFLRPLMLSTMVFTATACTTLQAPEVLPVRAIPQGSQFVQQRTASGDAVWTVCDSDCPLPTPKVIAQAVPMVTVRVAQAVKKVEPVQEIPPEKVALTTFFKLNASTLSDVQKSKLSGLVSGSYSWKSIRVIGKADPLGPRELNEKLAMARAQEMKGVLVAAGLPESQIELESRVETSAAEERNYVVGQLPATIAQQSRRADVEILRVKK